MPGPPVLPCVLAPIASWMCPHPSGHHLLPLSRVFAKHENQSSNCSLQSVYSARVIWKYFKRELPPSGLHYTMFQLRHFLNILKPLCWCLVARLQLVRIAGGSHLLCVCWMHWSPPTVALRISFGLSVLSVSIYITWPPSLIVKLASQMLIFFQYSFEWRR